MFRFQLKILVLFALILPVGVSAQTNPSGPSDKKTEGPKQAKVKGSKPAASAPAPAAPPAAQISAPDAEVKPQTGDQNAVASAPASSGTKDGGGPKQKLRKSISPASSVATTASPANAPAPDPEAQKKERDKAERARLARDQAWDAKMKKLLGGVCNGC